MTFQSEVLPRLRFANDPLRVAVAQIRFAAAPALRDPALLAEIAGRLPDFPEMTGPTSQVTIPMGEGAQFAVTQHAPARFRTKTGTTIVSIAPDSVSVETTDYPGWEAFSAQVITVLGALDALLPPHLTRLGLRYVNELMVEGAEAAADWARLLDPELVAFAGGERIGPVVRRSLEHLTLDLGADQITLRHGFVARRDLPDTATSSLYLFDIDAYTEQPQVRETSAVMAQLNRYHQHAWSLFRGSIGDEIVAALGGEPA